MNDSFEIGEKVECGIHVFSTSKNVTFLIDYGNGKDTDIFSMELNNGFLN